MRSEKIVGFLGSSIYIIIVAVMLYFTTCSASKAVSTPPGGMDVELGNSEDGLGENEVPIEASTPPPSNTVDPTEMTSDNTDEVDGTQKPDKKPNNNTSTNNKPNNNTNSKPTTNWGNVYGSSGGSSGNTQGSGNQGDPNGSGNGTGGAPCVGCPGSGYSFGLAGAIYKPVPSISNGDDGVVELRVKIDSQGNVTSVSLKSSTGKVSEESISIVKDAAWKTKFPDDPKAGSQLRNGILRYNLQNY